MLPHLGNWVRGLLCRETNLQKILECWSSPLPDPTGQPWGAACIQLVAGETQASRGRCATASATTSPWLFFKVGLLLRVVISTWQVGTPWFPLPSFSELHMKVPNASISNILPCCAPQPKHCLMDFPSFISTSYITQFEKQCLYAHCTLSQAGSSILPLEKTIDVRDE